MYTTATFCSAPFASSVGFSCSDQRLSLSNTTFPCPAIGRNLTETATKAKYLGGIFSVMPARESGLSTENDAQFQVGAQSSSPHSPQEATLLGVQHEDTSLVKKEVDDDTDLDSKNMANAPFVNKVWKIVNDPANHKYIRWVSGGKAIQIVDKEGFEKQLLPFYFKHKRFTSFVRQLNMYGWHKVQDLSAGTMQSSEEHWQFANPYFAQGHPELLRKIVRNKGHKPGQPSDVNFSSNLVGSGGVTSNSNNPPLAEAENCQDLKAILNELEQIKSRQIIIGEDLGRMRKDNEMLWSEYYQTRERYDKHSQMLSRILRFLATVYGNQFKILDLTNPNPPSAAAAGILGGSADHQQQQQYLGLPPANDQDYTSPIYQYNSNIHDLQEIEQMQHQIDEANTPSSVTSSKAPSSKSSSVSNSNAESTTLNFPADSHPNSIIRGGPVPTYKHHPAINRALLPSRLSSQVNPLQSSGPPPANAQSPRRIGHLNGIHSPRITAASPAPQNQLIKATNAHFGSPEFSQFETPAPATQPQSTPQLQELPASFEDPDKLFPELEDLNHTPNMPPLTSQELELISREVASNGTSLQNIHDWLSKQTLDNYNDEDQFNVDDFLASEDGDAGKEKSEEAVSEPGRKRVRVG